VRRFEYAEPTSLAEACVLLANHEEARPLGGGVALIILMRNQIVSPSLLVNLKTIPGLDAVHWDAQRGLRLGALVRHRVVETAPLIRAHCPVLAETARTVGSLQMRHRGTLGGNLCHADPAEDPPTVLTALDAELTLAGPAGERQLPMEQFVLGYYETAILPGEVLREIRVPPLPARSGAAYVRYAPRGATDMPLLGAAAVVGLDDDGACVDVRLALGNCDERPLRMGPVETALQGERPDERLIQQACGLIASAINPISDVRGSADYRRRMAPIMAARALGRALERARAAADAARGNGAD
jgi:carbon-monoxide dehydrogenase medium subunit